jgi:hypothetical protein
MNISPDQILLFDPGIGQINCGNGMNGGLVAVILCWWRHSCSQQHPRAVDPVDQDHGAVWGWFRSSEIHSMKRPAISIAALASSEEILVMGPMP